MRIAKLEENKQNRQVDEWIASKPQPPEGEPPSTVYIDSVIPYLLIPVLGFFIGCVVGSNVLFGGHALNEYDVLFMFLSPLAGLLSGVFLGILALVLAFVIYESRYTRWGGPQHEADLMRWKLFGDNDFRAWATTNSMVAMQLSVYLESDYYANQYGPKKKEVAEKVYIDDELGDLERELDNATPGATSGLNIPSVRRLEKSAKRFAASKESFAKEGRRYIDQVSFPMVRGVGLNSAGWYSSTELSDEELARIQKYVIPIYEGYGLDVRECWVRWKGFSDSGGGSQEFFSLVVRVA